MDAAEDRGGAEGRGGNDLTVEVTLPGRPTRPDLHDPAQRAAVETALRALPGVLAARIVPGYERPVDELHAVVDVDRTPKQTVRDLQTLLMARFDLSTDHRVFSVVQLPGTVVVPAAPARHSIDHVAVTHAGGEVRAEVAVRDEQDTVAAGHAVNTASPSGRRRAVAHATLDAVRGFLDDAVTLELEGVDIAALFNRRIATCLVQFRTRRGEHAVVGAALVRDAEEDAIARCVLDALNRTLTDTGG